MMVWRKGSERKSPPLPPPALDVISQEREALSQIKKVNFQEANQICLFFSNESEKFPISQEISHLRFESWRTSLNKRHWMFLSFNWINH